MKWLCFVLLILLSIGFVKAQRGNLVYNSSFEKNHHCPPYHEDPFPAKGWQRVLLSTPDYYHRCSKVDEFNVPYNWNGYCKPRKGNAYIGIGLVTIEDTDMELIQGKLTDSLQQNKYYRINFWVSLPHLSSDFYAKNIGAYLSKKRIWQDDIFQAAHYYEIIDSTYKAHITNNQGYLTDTNWIKIEGTYKAKGGEKYITIGMFWDHHPKVMEAYKKYHQNPGHPKKYAKRLGRSMRRNILKKNPHNKIDEGEYRHDHPYYLIDDVSVKSLSIDTIDQ